MLFVILKEFCQFWESLYLISEYVKSERITPDDFKL